MPGQELKKIRSQARAARKRAERRRTHHRKPAQRSDASNAKERLDAELARLVESSPVSQREISDAEEQEFLEQVIEVNAKALAQNSSVTEHDARVVLKALIEAGTLTLREDLHLVPVKPLEELMAP
ncbi:MAG: hypothetical protein HQL99_16860 [Magnetococcales bacterium]|nr:hypothetical protein [Magnetococcales bacterium]